MWLVHIIWHSDWFKILKNMHPYKEKKIQHTYPRSLWVVLRSICIKLSKWWRGLSMNMIWKPIRRLNEIQHILIIPKYHIGRMDATHLLMVCPRSALKGRCTARETLYSAANRSVIPRENKCAYNNKTNFQVLIKM